MSKRRSYSPEDVVKALDKAAKVLVEGGAVADACRKIGITEPTYCRWRNQYQGMDLPGVKRMKALSQENAVLKRLLAEAELEKVALRELAEGNF
ncbi:MAG: transposase [Mobiluncus sp.]|uniref:transposase n=1 Tax=Mobiluncus sp. TaxID=47293 RepID=UPI00258C3437|nr:transposase [Mobiluncus sp.]MCI6585208.1 transposase [Mobiluncus sp.]